MIRLASIVAGLTLVWSGSRLAPAPTAARADDADEAVQVCTATLKNRKERLDYRRRACTKLAALGPKAAPAIAALVECLSEDELGYWAACALRQIGPQAKEAVARLTKGGAKLSPRGQLLARLVRHEKEPYPTLLALLCAAEPQTRFWAVDILAQLGLVYPQLVKDLERPLETAARQARVAEVRTAAAFAVAKLRPASQTAVVLLTRVLIDKQTRPAQRAQAATMLGGQGARAGHAEQALVSVLAEPDPVLRQCAAWSLGQISQGEDETTVGALLDTALTAAAMGYKDLYEAARQSAQTIVERVREARRREALAKLARRKMELATRHRAEADKARAWAEANRLRVEREIAALQGQLADAKSRYNEMIYGGSMCYGVEAHLQDAAYHSSLAASCQESAAHWSRLGCTDLATSCHEAALQHDSWASYHSKTAKTLAGTS